MNDAGRQYSGSGRKTVKEVLTNLASIASGIVPAVGRFANTTLWRQKPATSAVSMASLRSTRSVAKATQLSAAVTRKERRSNAIVSTDLTAVSVPNHDIAGGGTRNVDGRFSSAFAPVFAAGSKTRFPLRRHGIKFLG